jgi:hypothetical protein
MNIQTLSAGLESAVPAVERLQTYALDRTTTGIGQILLCRIFFLLVTNGREISFFGRRALIYSV